MANKSAYFVVENLQGKRDVSSIKRQLDGLVGVTSVSVNPHNKQLAVDYDDTGSDRTEIAGLLDRLGYQVTAVEAPR